LKLETKRYLLGRSKIEISLFSFFCPPPIKVLPWNFFSLQRPFPHRDPPSIKRQSSRAPTCTFIQFKLGPPGRGWQTRETASNLSVFALGAFPHVSLLIPPHFSLHVLFFFFFPLYFVFTPGSSVNYFSRAVHPPPNHFFQKST